MSKTAPQLPAPVVDAMAGFLTDAATARLIPAVTGSRVAEIIQSTFRLAAALAVSCPEYLAAIGSAEVALSARCGCPECRREPLPMLLRRLAGDNPLSGGGDDLC